MKRIAFILSFIFCNTITSQVKDTVIGKVKSIREEIQFLNKDMQNYRLFSTDGDYGHSGFISNKATKSRFYSNWYESEFVHYLNYYKEFNTEGNPTNETWYGKDNKLEKKYEYKYNENKNLIQIKVINGYDSSYSITNYCWDDKNLLSTLTYYSDTPERFRYSNYLYDKKDCRNTIEFNNYDNEGPQSGYKIIFDENGKEKQKLNRNYWVYQYFKDGSSSYHKGNVGSLQLNQEYFYSANGNLIETQYYKKKYKDENEIEIGGKINNYYTHLNMLKFSITSDKDSISNIKEYKYDDLNLNIEKNFYYQRHLVKNDDILYESKIDLKELKQPKMGLILHEKLQFKYVGDILSELVGVIKYEDYRSFTCKFEYTFDDKKNWIEIVKYVNGEKLYVWKRKIIYYQ